MIYKFHFSKAGVPEPLLTPVWATFRLVSDGSEVVPQPAISEIGGGWYKTEDYEAAAPIVGILDGGATLEDADRYLAVDITPQDAHLDSAVSSRAAASVCTEQRLAELDQANLPTDISAVSGKVDALQIGTWQNYYNDSTYDTVGYDLVTGTLISGTADDTKAQGTQLVLAPDGTNVLDVNFRFPLSASRPSELTVRARYQGSGGTAASRHANIYFWNFALETPAWVLITDAGNRIADGAALSTYSHIVTDDFKDPATGEVRVRYLSSRVTAADRLYLDVHLIIGAVSGATAGDIASAVWTYNIKARALDGAHVTAGWYLSRMTTAVGGVTAVVGVEVTMSGDRFSDTVGLYNNRRVQFHKNGEDVYEVRRIVGQAAGGVLTLDRAPILVESSGWHGYILHEIDTDLTGVNTNIGVLSLQLPPALIDGRIAADVGNVQPVAVDQIQSGLAEASDVAAVKGVADDTIIMLEDVSNRVPVKLVNGRMNSQVSAVRNGMIEEDDDELPPDIVTQMSDLAFGLYDEDIYNGVSTLTSTCTEPRLAELDQANIPADIAAINVNPQDIRDAMKLAPTAGAPASGSVDAIISSTASVCTEPRLSQLDNDYLPTAVYATHAQVNEIEIDTQNLQARTPTALVNGRTPADVGSMQDNVITANKIATDAITAAKVSEDAVTKIQSGLATAAAVSNSQNTYTLVTAIKAIVDLLPDAGALTSIAKESTVGSPAGASIAADIAAVLSSLGVTDDRLTNETSGLAALKSVVEAVPTEMLASTIDGSADFAIAMKKILAYCTGIIVRTGSIYTYRNYNNTADELVLTGTADGRTRS